jgi:hypothetical protein
MTAEEWALAVSVFFSGLAAGFLGGLCTIIRPMQAAMSGPEFRNFMGAFLPVAKHGAGLAFNLAWSGGMFLGPIVALVLLWNDPGSTPFVLTAIGLGIVFIEPVEDTALQRDHGLGPRRDARRLGGRTPDVLHDQLGPAGDDLVRVRALPGGADRALGDRPIAPLALAAPAQDWCRP